MLEKVERFCQANHLLPQGAGILVACSGGPDSLALLELLWRLSSRYELRVAAAHFEHGIRGEVSKADADFVTTFCRERGIPVYVGAGDVPAEAALSGDSLEQTARRLRYAFLEATREAQQLQLLATAHHADDQAETVLMRILRGTGPDGLAAIRPRSGTDGHIIRPFLCLTKAEIQQWCARQKLQPRFDSTNALPDCTRNRLRLELLPQIRRDYNPEVSRGLCQLAEVAADEADYLERQADICWHDEQYVRHDGVLALSQAGIASQHPALQRRMLRRFWRTVTGTARDLGFVHVELLRQLIMTGQTGSRQQLPGGFSAWLDYGWLTCRRGPSEASLPAGDMAVPLQAAGQTAFGDICLTARCLDAADVPARSGSNMFFFDPSNVPRPLVLRYRQPGDWIALPAGRKKLKALFIDDKVPRIERDRWPLLAAGQEILWVIGKRRTSHFPVNPDILGKKILYLTLRKREEFYHDE